MTIISAQLKKKVSFIKIALVILAAVAAVALTALIALRQGLNTNESSAIIALKTMNKGLAEFKSKNKSYPVNLEARKLYPDYINIPNSSGIANRFDINFYKITYFTLPPPYANDYIVWAEPLIKGITGNRLFFTSSQGVICAGEELGDWRLRPCTDTTSPIE